MHRREFLNRVVTSTAGLAWADPVGLFSSAQAQSSRLLWHVEDWQGRVISSWQSDHLANPASVTKVITSLLALRRYTPAYRYSTTFVPKGSIDPITCTLHGDLHVYASGDPDFHFENALLVGAHLNRLGFERVTGHLIIHGQFHMRWNDGRVPGSRVEWERYVLQKGTRLRQVWDWEQWGPPEEEVWTRFSSEQAETLSGFRGVRILGGTRALTARSQLDIDLAVVHHSNPLLRMLKRFNSYSNNDIERIGQQLGGAPALERFLVEEVGLSEEKVRFSSTSGLESNRLSPRAMVRVLRSFIELSRNQQFELLDVLPVAGIDEGTLSDRFTEPSYSGAIVAKSGQLVRTDGGVAALSGVSYTRKGPFLFAIFHVRTSRRVQTARSRIDRTLREFIDQRGGPAPLDYQGGNFPTSYDQIQVEIVGGNVS